jgi:GAF domain-containing protein
MGSALAVPLVHRDRLVGVLAVENTQPETFTERDVEFFSMLSRYLAPIVLLLMEPLRHP